MKLLQTDKFYSFSSPHDDQWIDQSKHYEWMKTFIQSNSSSRKICICQWSQRKTLKWILSVMDWMGKLFWRLIRSCQQLDSLIHFVYRISITLLKLDVNFNLVSFQLDFLNNLISANSLPAWLICKPQMSDQKL